MHYNTPRSIFLHNFPHSLARLALLLLAILALSGCGLLGRGDSTGEVAEVERAPIEVVPTFTPTPEGGEPTAAPAPVAPASTPEATATAADAAPAAAESITETTAVTEASDTVTDTMTDTVNDDVSDTAGSDAADGTDESTDESTDSSAPTLFVDGDLVNVRQGPGIEYGLVGSVNQGQALEITGRNPLGDWWQICCVNGQTGWIFGQLARVENAENVSVAQDIPPAPQPVAAAPAPAEPAPIEPTAAPAEPAPAAEEPTPEEPAAEEPAPAPANDPCAGIGGDGCKFKVSGGPQFGPSGGELKLNLYFIHSGVDGGQPQGSYFIVLEKDGQAVGIPDSVRSIALESRQGSLGNFNYEYKIPAGELPGGTVAGNYTMWVLDGNAERDSQNTSFTVPEGQGEVRIVWDQG